ncbi:MAG: hypothetical protein ABI743_11530, partial [bacterium]
FLIALVFHYYGQAAKDWLETSGWEKYAAVGGLLLAAILYFVYRVSHRDHPPSPQPEAAPTS